MINLKELCEAGHRQFMFSDGVVREVLEVEHGNPRFDMPDGSSLFFEEDGVNNLRLVKYPNVVGAASPQNVNIQKHGDKWWLEVPHTATMEQIEKAWEELNNG